MPLDLKHHHGGISVPDLEASISWFAKVLDFKVERRFEIAAIPAKVAMLRRGELRVELFEVTGASALPAERREPSTDLKTHGNKHLAFAVQNVDAFASDLKSRGAEVVWVRRDEIGANMFIRDNAGNLIEFLEEPGMWTA